MAVNSNPIDVSLDSNSGPPQPTLAAVGLRIAVIPDPRAGEEQERVLVGPRPRAREGSRRHGHDQESRSGHRHGKSRSSLFCRRVCYCILVIPFFIVFVTSILSVMTFAIKNEEVKQKCPNIHCLLTCKDDHKTNMGNCWMAYGGGTVMCFVAVLFIISLVVRMCYGCRTSCPCALFELLVLFLFLGLSLVVAITVSLGVEMNMSCRKESFKHCGDKTVDEQDLFDFLRQSYISLWISCGCLIFILSVWIIMTLSLALARPSGGGSPSERDPLIAT